MRSINFLLTYLLTHNTYFDVTHFNQCAGNATILASTMAVRL